MACLANENASDAGATIRGGDSARNAAGDAGFSPHRSADVKTLRLDTTRLRYEDCDTATAKNQKTFTTRK
jgi:hypothetical protein